MQYGPAKLMTRKKGDYVRAYIASLDESEKVEIASMAVRIFEEDDTAFEEWVAILTRAVDRFTEKVTGQKVVETIRTKPANKN